MTPTMHMCTELDVAMKPTNARICIKVSYNMPPTCFVHKEGALQRMDISRFTEVL